MFELAFAFVACILSSNIALFGASAFIWGLGLFVVVFCQQCWHLIPVCKMDPSCLQVFCNSVMMQPYCAPYPWTHEELCFTVFSSELEPLLLQWFHPEPIWEWRILSTWISIATTLVTYLKRSANTKVENGNDIFSISSGMRMYIHKLQFACWLDSKGPHSSKWRNTLDVFCGLMKLCARRSTEIAACCQEQHDYLCPIVCVLTYALICFQSVEIIFVPIPPISICQTGVGEI